MDKLKHTNVRFVEEENLGIHVQNPLFKMYEELNGSIFEVEKKKKKVVLDNPIQIGIAVYSYAKLNLISFWEFLNKYLVNDMYQLMECDTDSLYVALARDTVDECVKPDLLDEWNEVKWNFFSSEDEETLVEFNGHIITKKEHDKRSPGKYKEEFNGVGMIYLNSKVYHIWSDQYKDGELITKTSCKGMQKRRNEFNRDIFLSMLTESRQEHMVENAGFIREGLETRTYTQQKRGLNYFYCKRKVLSDGINTTHLDI